MKEMKPTYRVAENTRSMFDNRLWVKMRQFNTTVMTTTQSLSKHPIYENGYVGTDENIEQSRTYIFEEEFRLTRT